MDPILLSDKDLMKHMLNRFEEYKKIMNNLEIENNNLITENNNLKNDIERLKQTNIQPNIGVHPENIKIKDYTDTLQNINIIIVAKSKKWINEHGIELQIERDNEGMITHFKDNRSGKNYNSPTAACKSLFNSKWAGPHHFFYKKNGTWESLRSY